MTQDYPNQPGYPSEQSPYPSAGDQVPAEAAYPAPDEQLAAFGQPTQDPATEYSSTSSTEYSDTTRYSAVPQAPDAGAWTAPTGATSGSSDGSSDEQSGTVDTAKEQAGAVAENAKQAGAQVAGTAKEQATNVAVEAKSQARDLLHQTRGEVSDQAATQQQRVASGIRSLGDELKSMASNSEQQGVASDLAQRAAHHSHRIASFLEDREPGDVLAEVSSFARRRPAAFLLMAAGAGLLAGRLTRGVVADAQSDRGDDTARSDATAAGGYSTGDTAGGYSTGTGAGYGTGGGYGTGDTGSGYATGGAYGTGSTAGYGTGGYGTGATFGQAGEAQ